MANDVFVFIPKNICKNINIPTHRNFSSIYWTFMRLFLDLPKHGTGVTQHGQVQILNMVSFQIKHNTV